MYTASIIQRRCSTPDACHLNMHEMAIKLTHNAVIQNSQAVSSSLKRLLLRFPSLQINLTHANNLYRYFITSPAVSSPFLYSPRSSRSPPKAFAVSDQHSEVPQPGAWREVEVHWSAYMLIIDSYTRARRHNPVISFSFFLFGLISLLHLLFLKNIILSWSHKIL